jgi:CubicO group peptidase (beta-lactamase class C family)
MILIFSGVLEYEKYYGTTSYRGEPIGPNTIFSLASMTKLPTSVAALQLVERGLINLDEDLSQILPVLGTQHILCGFKAEGLPILQERCVPITLRQLLTHSAGLGYDFSDEPLARFQAQRCRAVPSGATINDRFDLPLLFEPGTSWNYSCAIDWVGKLVQELTGTPLDDYMQANIWEPLGVTEFKFWPFNSNMFESHAVMAKRDEKTGELKEQPEGLWLNVGAEEAFGGQGGYCSAKGYMELLHSILLDDQRVLRSATAKMMFEPQLSNQSQHALQERMKDLTWAIGDFDTSDTFNWGLGGMLVNMSQHGSRGKLTLVWSGAPNLFWVSTICYLSLFGLCSYISTVH